MLGQGQLKGQDMIMTDPGENGDNFKVVIFATKKTFFLCSI